MKPYTKKEKQILTLITNFCQNECSECQCCPEEECVLFNIEQVITKDKERSKNEEKARIK